MTRSLACLLLMSSPFALVAQAPDELLQAAREIIAASRYCFFITNDNSGQPQARLMQQFPPDDNFTIWMGTNPRSRKAAQIRANPRAAVACSDVDGPGYVTLTGRARLVDSPPELRKRWRPDWDAHFPGGPDGPNYILIEFSPSRLEVVSGRHKIGVAPNSPRPPALLLHNGQWQPARD
jgi:general stress protein 26